MKIYISSVSLELLHKGINFVKIIRDITEKDIPLHTGNRTSLFNKKQSSVKKSGNKDFDFPMECFDSAEVCELVDVYILHLVRTVMRKENVVLCHDDGLGKQRNSSGPEIERKGK